jgi:hypothetical protein
MDQAETDGKRFELDGFKAHMVAEANRAQAATQSYIEQLTDTLKSEEKKKLLLEKKVEKRNKKIAKIANTIKDAKERADSEFTNTLSMLVNSFEIEPPWDAAIEFDNGKPVAVIIKKLENKNPTKEQTNTKISSKEE